MLSLPKAFFLTNNKTPPSNDLIRSVIQKSFRNSIYNHDKSNLNCILYSKCTIRNILGIQQWKIHLKKKIFHCLPSLDLQLKWLQNGPIWSFSLYTKYSFLALQICMIIIPQHFPFGFSLGWFGNSTSILPGVAKEGWVF